MSAPACDLAPAIAAWRAQLGLSLEQAGALLGVSHTAVRDWEHGRRPHPENLDRVAAAVGCVVLHQTPLRALRVRKGLSSAQLARALHVSDSTVALWERGRRRPDPRLMSPLAEALDLAHDETAALFDGYPPSRFQGVFLPRLRVVRLARGVSQRALASAAGVTPLTLAAWEHGRVAVPPVRLGALASGLGCDVRMLVALARPNPDSPVDPLVRLRTAAGLTRRAAARRLGLSPLALERFECGLASLDDAAVVRMARCYRCAVTDVVRAARWTHHQCAVQAAGAMSGATVSGSGSRT